MKTFISALVLTFSVLCLNAQKENEPDKKQLKFTTIISNPITSIKNQFRSGTCWCYATLAFFESEILHKTGKTYDLSEMFIVNKDYMDQAIFHTRMHGLSKFSEGGSCDDALEMIKANGIVPENVMPKPGSLVGDTLANFTEFFPALEGYVSTIAKGNHDELSPAWKTGVQGIIDSYIGKCPTSFTYNGKTFTPKSFAKSLGLDWNDYISITSFTHHPFYEKFAIEAPYKWRWSLSHNVPLADMMTIIDQALDAGYTVAWGGDVSEVEFTRNGIAININNNSIKSLKGTDAARWLNLSKNELSEKLSEVDSGELEAVATQESRQERFDNWKMTYDHVMLIYGKAKDQNGKEYYMVKNSWGTSSKYKGTWYMSKNYIADNTIYIFLNRKAISKSMAKQIKL